MAVTNYAESWLDNYDKYKTIVNFVAGDFQTLKDAIRRYIVIQNPENYNDWAESSEVGMFSNGLAYLGEALQYRVDLNAHDIFPSTTERRQSLLNFVKMLSYSPKRNIAALGLAKITSVSTTQAITDSSGTMLQNVPVTWADSSNNNWSEQFLTIMNAAFTANNPYGKPLKKEIVSGISTQLYELNNMMNYNGAYSFTASVNGDSEQFEVVNADINTTLKTIFERSPAPEKAFHILYRNDGTGNASKDTGFFVYWKQGSLKHQDVNIDQKIENNDISIMDENINEYDVWVQELNSASGLVKSNWTKIANDEYLVYNNVSSETRNIFKVETRADDEIIIRFSDGRFGTIPVGLFRVWYRVSNGNDEAYIKPADIKNVQITIPYKSNNSSDNNTYTLTLTLAVQDISHIRQSVAQESMEEIRTKSPQVYSTQNRMVTGQDYNYFPKGFGQQLKMVKAIERTYAGNSRYVKFNDPTGTYQDLNILAEDGYLYANPLFHVSNYVYDGLLKSETIVDDYILPLISSMSFDNFFYKNFKQQDYKLNDSKIYWREDISTGTNTSKGHFVKYTHQEAPDESANVIIPFTQLSYLDDGAFLTSGSFVSFKNLQTGDVCWVKIAEMIPTEIDTSYSITINDVLEDSGDDDWVLDTGFNPLVKTFGSTKADIESKIDDQLAFGIGYDYANSTWVVMDGEHLASDDVPFDPEPNFTSDNSASWVIKATFESPTNWSFKVRWLNYIFGSESKVAFFFNEDERLNNTSGFYTRDYIKVLDINTHQSGETYGQDFYWKPSETIKYTDGYTDTQKIKVYGYDSDKDSSIDNPIQFETMIGNDNSNLYFFYNEEGTESEATFKSGIEEVNTMWGYTTKSGIIHTQIPCTIYPAGTYIPEDVTLTKSIRLSNGRYIIASESNPIVFASKNGEGAWNIYDFDIVDEGKLVTWDLDENGYPINVVSTSIVGPELINWDATTGEMLRYVNGVDYIVKQGVSGLKFIWEHFASSNYVIDPCPTNIIDMYAMTNTYYNEVQTWLQNGKTGLFPKLPTSYELKSMFAELEQYNMVSDTLVWHPIKYKILFGNEASSEYKASFNVIKNPASTMSDNEIKQQVVMAIDDYFSFMETGSTFFFTQLSTYIHERLGGNIGTIVIVPKNADDKFGTLFEIACEDDEILLSSASIDDIQIISRITANNIRMIV